MMMRRRRGRKKRVYSELTQEEAAAGWSVFVDDQARPGH